MKRLILVVALWWPLVVVADFNAGLDAYDRGDFATALKEWRPLAEDGDASAQFYRGLMYHYGEGVPQDHAEALIAHFKKVRENFGGKQSSHSGQ